MEEDGEEERILIIIEDLSEKKQLENELIRSGKLAALGELSAGLAHEINNPLAIISGYAQMFQAEPTMDEARKQRYLKEIVEQTDRTARIMCKVKDFARPGETRMESVTHSLVNRHHGTIAMESEVGKGTTFVITFPLSSEEAEK